MEQLVSVVIATYNRREPLQRAVASVLAQTYKNIEIIIVDDNKDKDISGDVKTIVEAFNDDRIRLIKNKSNLGGALTRNEGIKNSRGEYIAFLDDDDEYLPQKIEKQLDLFRRSDNKLALVYGYCASIDSQGKTRNYQYDYRGNCIYDAMRMCIAATSQWMCRKSALEAVGMFSNVPCKQDSTLIVKLLAAGFTLDRVPEVLSIYHDEDIPRISIVNKKTINKRIAGEETLRDLCRSHYDLITSQQQKEIEYVYACALIGYYQYTNQKVEFKQCFNRIIRTHPFAKRSIQVYRSILKKVLIKSS